jgi:hypothetical protein
MRPRLKKPLLLGGLSLFVLRWVTQRVTAHDVTHSAAAGIGPLRALGAVVLVGLLSGLGAANASFKLGWRLPAISGTAVGFLLVAVGVMTAAPVLAARPVMGSSGLILGGAVGGSLTFRTAHTHTDVTVGAIGFHRLVEGISLAAVLHAGSVIGAVGFVVISGHTIVECTAIGGHPGLDRRRAVAAVVLIESVFVAGVFLGAVGVTTAAVPVSWLSAAVGSVLLMVGVDETGLLNQA